MSSCKVVVHSVINRLINYLYNTSGCVDVFSDMTVGGGSLPLPDGTRSAACAIENVGERSGEKIAHAATIPFFQPT